MLAGASSARRELLLGLCGNSVPAVIRTVIGVTSFASSLSECYSLFANVSRFLLRLLANMAEVNPFPFALF